MGKYHKSIPDDDEIARKVVDAVCKVYNVEPEFVEWRCDFVTYLGSSSYDWKRFRKKLGKSFGRELDDDELDMARHSNVGGVVVHMQGKCCKNYDVGE